MQQASNYKHHIWEPQRAASELFKSWLRRSAVHNPALRRLGRTVAFRAAIRLSDIVDHLELSDKSHVDAFQHAGWALTPENIFANKSALLPPILRSDENFVWVRVESVDQAVAGLSGVFDFDPIEGDADASLRRVKVRLPSPVTTGVGFLERNGASGFNVQPISADEVRRVRRAYQFFASRRRQYDDASVGLQATANLVNSVVDDIGTHRACSIWLRAEREYWMTRCKAGRLQKQRQDHAGVGWSNVDHHTYDGSRQYFAQTISILKKLGYEVREMLYAGELAGWGSQVLEQPVIGSTIFADVDLAPEELTIDFAHEPLPVLPRHRRAGLLSALLGESILEAGLNHVAGLYDQRRMRLLMRRQGISMMPPFSHLPHLYQELTVGDWGGVDPTRVEALAAAGHIDSEEAEELMTRGAIVTHLENIERNDGYKGFNREGIDSVLRKLDPRAYRTAAEAA